MNLERMDIVEQVGNKGDKGKYILDEVKVIYLVWKKKALKLDFKEFESDNQLKHSLRRKRI